MMREFFAAALAAGGAVSGEHGLGTEKAGYFLELADPVAVSVMRKVEEALDPRGMLGPAALFR